MSENEYLDEDNLGNEIMDLSLQPPTLPASPFVSKAESGHDELDVVSTDAYLATVPQVESVEGDEATLVQYDSEGNQHVTTIDFASPPLNTDEAREITERIKSTTNLLFLLIKRAHAGKAYKALGYTSFETYVREEFNYSKGYAYRLINQANVIEAIEAKLPEGTEVYINEPVSQKLKKVLPELLEEIEERVPQGTSPEHAEQILDELINEHKDNLANTFLEEDDDEDEYENDGYQGMGNGHYDDDEGPDTSSLDELESEKSELAARFERSYNLYMTVQSMKATKDAFDKSDTGVSELIAAYPKKRMPELLEALEEVLPWLNEIKEEASNTDFSEGDSEEEYSAESSDEEI